MPGVYVPQSDSCLLAEAIRREKILPGTEVLDVCTGSGVLAIYAARLGARVTAVDIAWRAVAAARLNARLASQRVVVRRGDLLAPLPRGRTFDVLVSNPPYVPAPGTGPPRGGASRSWDAGEDGRALVDRICTVSPGALRPGGVLLMVQSALSGPETTVQRLNGAGLEASVSDRVSVPFGPVLRERRSWLQERGLVRASDDREELVIIRARKP